MRMAHNFRQGELTIHYRKHGLEFGPISQKAYLQKARSFLNQTANNYQIMESVRGSAWGAFSGDRVRFNFTTGEFGNVSTLGYIRTYYIPNPAVHAYAANYDYFLSQT